MLFKTNDLKSGWVDSLDGRLLAPVRDEVEVNPDIIT